MIYYQVLPQYDNKARKDGSILVGNELYTKKEMQRFSIPESYVQEKEVKKSNVYFFFGARFESVDAYD